MKKNTKIKPFLNYCSQFNYILPVDDYYVPSKSSSFADKQFHVDTKISMSSVSEVTGMRIKFIPGHKSQRGWGSIFLPAYFIDSGMNLFVR